MKFICDEMFKGLARWLRAAGYDTEITQDGEPDRKLIEHARSSGRLLLTRDSKLMEFRNASDTVLLIDCTGIDDCARKLKSITSISWLHRPFSRCLICNTTLNKINKHESIAVPDDVRGQQLYLCPDCQRIYWSGGHVNRMRKKLEGWEHSGL
ncbi:Mut7-C RNAse domain-containing protein [Kaarinaea lacus]